MEKHLVAAVDDLHGSARAHRQDAGTKFRCSRLPLAAEAAPYVRLDHPDPAHRQSEHPRELMLDIVGHLGRCPKSEFTSFLISRQARVRFNRGLHGPLCCEAVLPDVIGFREPLFHVAKVMMHFRVEVALRLLVELRCAFFHRLKGIEDRRQNLILYIDQTQSLRSRILVLGSNTGNFIPNVTDFVLGKDILVVTRRADSVEDIGHIFADDDCYNTRELLRLVR